MLNLDLTDEQRQLQEMVRDFAEREIRPHVMEWDEKQEMPLEILRRLGGLGVLGVVFPEDLGGAGMGYVEYAIVMEELARVDPSVALSVLAHLSLAAGHIYQHGGAEQKRRYLPKLASGEWIGCWSLTEPDAGSDAAGTKTTAVRDGESWVLNGSKTFTTNAHQADLCVVMAVTDPGLGTHGISAFIVEKGTPGFSTGRKENKLGMRASDTGELIFSGCRVPAENLIGRRGRGFVQAMRILDGGRVAISGLGVGLARGAYEAALSYAKQRRQFGKRISEFQFIQHKLTDMATEIDASRLLTYRAAWMLDQGRRVTKEAAMAKLFSSEAAVRVANEAVQIFGGYGFVKDYPVEKFYRDVKLLTIGEGTSEIQRMVIARQILKD